MAHGPTGTSDPGAAVPGPDACCDNPTVTTAAIRDERWLRSARYARCLAWASLAWMGAEGLLGLIAGFILAEQRPGHEVPGMRGSYTHVSDRMREALVKALQARWEDSLRARAAIRPHSTVPLLNELLTPPTPPTGGRRLRQRHRPAPGDPDHPWEARRS
jgi:hypothetical protein